MCVNVRVRVSAFFIRAAVACFRNCLHAAHFAMVRVLLYNNNTRIKTHRTEPRVLFPLFAALDRSLIGCQRGDTSSNIYNILHVGRLYCLYALVWVWNEKIVCCWDMTKIFWVTNDDHWISKSLIFYLIFFNFDFQRDQGQRVCHCYNEVTHSNNDKTITEQSF